MKTFIVALLAVCLVVATLAQDQQPNAEFSELNNQDASGGNNNV